MILIIIVSYNNNNNDNLIYKVPVCQGTSVVLANSSKLGVNVWQNKESLQPRFKNRQ